MKQIKFSKLNITDRDIKVVNLILKSGWLTHGNFNSMFENEIKKFTKSKYALTVSSCTAGLHLSCIASGFKKGDEVIVPAQTHTATSHAVEFTGAKVVFADVEPYTGNLNLSEIRKKVTRKTKGVIIVHMAGYPCNVSEIYKFCKEKKIILLEDCAHAVGTLHKKKHVGNFGNSGSFSFYPTKQITTGEGGAIITNNRKFYEKIKTLKAFGIDKDIKDRKKQGDYDVIELGYNYRMTDFQASLGYHQLLRYNLNLKKRHAIVKRYIKNLSKKNKIKHMPYSSDCSYFVFQIFSKNRDSLLKKLKKNKIGVSVHYLNCVPSMTYYKKKYDLKIKNFQNAKVYGDTNISLPVYPKLTFSEVDKICKIISS